MYDAQAFGLVRSLIDENRWLGTAFAFIRQNWFVTAKHVVIEHGAPRRDLAIQVLGNKSLVRAIYPHPSRDIALLVLDEGLCSVPFMPAADVLGQRRLLLSLGYSPRIPDDVEPLRFRIPKPDDRPEGPEFPIYTHIVDAYAVETRERNDGTEHLMVFDAPNSLGGNSGGPVINETGGVVAVMTEQHPNGETILVKATSVIPMLGLLRLPPIADELQNASVKDR